ncbi:MAG: hypothetical protein F6K19_30155 [Cyanothece sp. SIO1E1]|nr:hypothetical protein [Cyanothece sp. SIO1E1]
MIKTTQPTTSLLVMLLGLFTSTWLFAKGDIEVEGELPLSITEAENLRYRAPDSSAQLLELYYAKAMESVDTLKAIQVLKALSGVYGHQAKYKDSYDRLWTALLLADHAELEIEKSAIYRAIGRYYGFYRREKKAIENLQISLRIAKSLLARKELDSMHLVENYRALCATYREMDKPRLAKIYLDSAMQFYSPELGMAQLCFIRFEQAIIRHKNGEYHQAIASFEELLPWFKTHKPSFLVLFYKFMGDTYHALNHLAESEKCYQLALDISRRYHSHVDFTPLVHQELSQLYYKQGDFQQAYEQLRITKELDATFFDSRSSNNLPLLEIQDAYRKEKETKRILLQEQHLAKLKQEEKVLFLQRIILIACIIFLLLFGMLAFKYIRNKHQTEKQVIQRKRKLEVQQTEELVELKNKELAAFALKLIEKEAFIKTLKNRLSKGNGGIQEHEVKQIVRSISHSNSEHWKEFEARFVSVNKSFYERLSQRFPVLTEGDKKLCALVKLNFSSKEMAKLLGISIASVHTTRYRLRKKLNLTRDINLTEFIAEVSSSPVRVQDQ